MRNVEGNQRGLVGSGMVFIGVVTPVNRYDSGRSICDSHEASHHVSKLCDRPTDGPHTDTCVVCPGIETP